MRLDIGMPYVRGCSLLLAVAPDTLATSCRGRIVVRQARPTDRSLREPVSVDRILQAWRVDLEALDAMSAHYLAPQRSGRRPPSRPRGNSEERLREAREMRRVRVGR